MTEDSQLVRCAWVGSDPLYLAYHDDEWGVPLHGDRELFELLTLEGAQAGLSWLTILKRRIGYRRAFAGFDPERVAAFGDAERERLLADPGIVRNRAKVDATIQNARALLQMWSAGEGLDELVWSFVEGEARVNRFHTLGDIPAETPESKAMSKALKQRDFAFVGPTICYAFMQAAGLVNDHTIDCFRWAQLGGK
jgi:DNA-3-methyladenine glycosylase I